MKDIKVEQSREPKMSVDISWWQEAPLVLAPSHRTKARYDLIARGPEDPNGTTSLICVQGCASYEHPIRPDVPKGYQAIVYVYVAASTTAIMNIDIEKA